MGSIADHMNAAMAGNTSLADREIAYWANPPGGGGGGGIPYPTALAPANLATVGPLIPAPGASSTAIRESIRLPYTSALTSTNKAGDVVNLIGVTLQPDGTMPYTKGWVAIGDSNLDYIHLLSKLDCAGQPVIDSNFFGNSEGLYNPRLSQALDSTVVGYDALTVGISSMPAAGVGYTNALDRLVFNSGQTTANSRATFKNLGSVELLSDTMALKFGAAGDTSLARSIATGSAGVRATGDFSASGLLQAGGNLQTGSGNLVASANVAFAMYANNITALPVATFVNTSGSPTGNFDFSTAGGVTPTLVLSGAGTAADVNISLAPKGVGAINIASGGVTQKIGFYGTAATAKQTGVAVTIAAVHAALVTLGLIGV